ncbi:MAG: c-type cytochrome [Flavobacteriaceae bacterium]|nr:c-type cytochrome [Flavobacteriaceae bacterium]
MKTFSSLIRVLLFLAVAFILFEVTVDSGDQWAIQKHPIIWAVLSVLLIFAIAIEIAVSAMRAILYKSLNAEAKERYLEIEALEKENQFSWFKTTYNKLLGSKPIEKEADIILDHNYDGIKELDNTLPPWWVYLFYISIVFGVVYLARYHVFDGVSTTEEYELEVAQAKLDIAEYKKTAKGLVDASTVELLTEESDLAAGKAIFADNCVACHKADGGGGIGPNLTDPNWILGGGIKNVFATVSEGGRDGKGMVAWKSELKPLEIAQVSSYLLGFEGTTPASPKAAEGDVWKEEGAESIDDAPSEEPDQEEASE